MFISYFPDARIFSMRIPGCSLFLFDFFGARRTKETSGLVHNHTDCTWQIYIELQKCHANRFSKKVSNLGVNPCKLGVWCNPSALTRAGQAALVLEERGVLEVAAAREVQPGEGVLGAVASSGHGPT